jgi:hypothetical protein
MRHGYHAVFTAAQAARAGIDITPAGAALALGLSLTGVSLISATLAWYWPTHLAHRINWSFLLLTLGIGWLALLLLAGLPRAYTIKRQLVILLPFLALFVAYGLARLPRPGGELVAGIGLLVTFLFLPGHQREPWRTVVLNLSRSESSQETLVWVDELAAPVFDYYLSHNLRQARTIRWTPLIRRHLPQLPDLTSNIGETLWVVTVDSPYYNLIGLLPLEFHHHYRLLKIYYEPGIALYHYARQIESSHSQEKMLTSLSETRSTDQITPWQLLLPSPLDTCQMDTR